MLVKSKYVNPDRFIAKLKDELNRARTRLFENTGSFITSLNCEQTSDKWGKCFDDLIPGDTLIAICNVDKVTLYEEKGKRAGSIDLTATQLRKR